MEQDDGRCAAQTHIGVANSQIASVDMLKRMPRSGRGRLIEGCSRRPRRGYELACCASKRGQPEKFSTILARRGVGVVGHRRSQPYFLAVPCHPDSGSKGNIAPAGHLPEAAVSISAVTSPGWETITACEAPAISTVFLACARSAMNFMTAAGIFRSAVP